MMQSRTHTCGQLRIENAGERVTLVGWMENVRVVGNNFAFIVLRDFYGTTQIVVETEEIMNIVKESYRKVNCGSFLYFYLLFTLPSCQDTFPVPQSAYQL